MTEGPPHPEADGATPDSPPPRDNLSKRGALDLARRLEKYWHGQGYPAAKFWTEPVDERFQKIFYGPSFTRTRLTGRSQRTFAGNVPRTYDLQVTSPSICRSCRRPNEPCPSQIARFGSLRATSRISRTAIPVSGTLQARRQRSRYPMLRVIAKHTSISATPRFADSGFSASGRARIRLRAMRDTQAATRASFSLVVRRGNIAGMRNCQRNAEEIQRACHHGCTNKPSKRNCSQRSNSTVHRSFAGISRWLDDEFWASQGSFAWSPYYRAHRR